LSKPNDDNDGDDFYYTMSRRALLIGNYICIVKAKQLADSALKLLSSDDANDHTNALGLYTLAIEEFGKAAILKDECFRNDVDDDDPISQKIPKGIFSGKDAHNRKFKEAVKRLPPECKDIMVGTYRAFPSGIPTKDRLGRRGPYISIPKDVSGNFFGQYTASMDMRMSCFFVDWDETRKKWIFNMKVENKEELQKALTTFKEKILDYDIVTMIERKSKGGGQSAS
jgi:AbiV family abortive infection protein